MANGTIPAALSTVGKESQIRAMLHLRRCAPARAGNIIEHTVKPSNFHASCAAFTRFPLLESLLIYLNSSVAQIKGDNSKRQAVGGAVASGTGDFPS
jgi:hypothetical protein